MVSTTTPAPSRLNWLGQKYRSFEKVILGTAGILGFIVLWELASMVGLINPLVLSSPSRVSDALVGQIQSGMLWDDLVVSLSEIAIAFAIAAVIGVTVGTLMSLSETTESVFDPFVWGLYMSPHVAFIPLLIIWLGFGRATVVAVAVMIAVVPIIVNTQSGIKNANPTLLQAADAFGAGRWERTVRVLVPCAIPMILAGFRLAIGRVLIGVVVGEMFSSNAGLGFRMTYYGQLVRAADVLVPMLAIVILGVCATQLIRVVEDRTQAWRG
jgi:NitT/TauT family transport system permease protein